MIYKYQGLGCAPCAARAATYQGYADQVTDTAAGVAAGTATTSTTGLIAAGTLTGVLVWGLTRFLDKTFSKSSKR